jgi:tryptophan 2,3-dioxygenase
MPNNYGDNPPLSYNKYLRVQDLINLQDCLSDPAHHDELLFITVHQAYELWFKQILHEIDAAIQFIGRRSCARRDARSETCGRDREAARESIHFLESMTPISFLAFRDQLNPRVVFSRCSFAKSSFSSGLKDKNILREVFD